MITTHFKQCSLFSFSDLIFLPPNVWRMQNEQWKHHSIQPAYKDYLTLYHWHLKRLMSLKLINSIKKLDPSHRKVLWKWMTYTMSFIYQSRKNHCFPLYRMPKSNQITRHLLFREGHHTTRRFSLHKKTGEHGQKRPLFPLCKFLSSMLINILSLHKYHQPAFHTNLGNLNYTNLESTGFVSLFCWGQWEHRDKVG